MLIEPLLTRLKDHEPNVHLLRVEGLEDGEHCEYVECLPRSKQICPLGDHSTYSHFWHVDAVEIW